MANTRNRNRDYMTYHHLMSRIAHKVYFMNDEVRNDFIEMIRRAADFCGVTLISWCIMTNHFHLLVHLPVPPILDESEVLRRFGVLKGASRLAALVKELTEMRRQGSAEEKIQERLNAIKRHMYDIGEFMKIVKQWMTQEYNQRYSHVGTLWEAVYKDVLVKGTPNELGKRAGYIHLNPIRAAMTDDFDGYPWSSYTALARGDELALAGMRLIYGPDVERGEIITAHRELMATLLEQIKLERAQDIARKRLAGFNAPADPLTNEALIAQESARLESVMAASVEQKGLNRGRGRPSRINELIAQIQGLLAQDPEISIDAIVREIGCSRRTAFRCLAKARQK